jgi:hypothetical protein
VGGAWAAIVISAGRLRPPAGRAGWPHRGFTWKEPVHARLLGHQPGQRSQRAWYEARLGPNGNNDHTKEVPLRDHRGRLRPPAYVLIALVIALVAILLLLAGVLFAPD